MTAHIIHPRGHRTSAARRSRLMRHHTTGVALLFCFLGTAVASAQTVQFQVSPVQGTASAQDPTPATPPQETPATAPPPAPQEPVAVAQVSEQHGFFHSLFSQLG